MKTLLLGALALAAGAGCLAAQSYLPGRSAGVMVGDRGTDQILYLVDFNLDGDWLDAGEVRPWYSVAGTFQTVQDLAVGTDGTLYATDSGPDHVFAMVDANVDGDADDAGEGRVYFDNANASGIPFASPMGMTVEARNGVPTGSPADVVWFANSSNGAVNVDSLIRCSDVDGDGDAQDAGEAVVFWSNPASVLAGNPNVDLPTGVWVDAQGRVFLMQGNTTSGSTVGGVYLLRDLGGTPGANDAGEVTLFWALPPLPPPPPSTFHGVFGLAGTRDGALLVSDRGTFRAVYRLIDSTGDDDALDAGESGAFWTPAGASLVDNVVEVVDWTSTTSVLVAEDQAPDRVLRLTDVDGNATITAGEEFTPYDNSVPGVTVIVQSKVIEALPGPTLAGPAQVAQGSTLVLTHTSVRGHVLNLAFDLFLAPQIIPPFGTYMLSPFAMPLVLGAVVPPSGTYTFAATVPFVPALSGVTVFFQSVDLDGVSGWLSNAAAVTIL